MASRSGPFALQPTVGAPPFATRAGRILVAVVLAAAAVAVVRAQPADAATFDVTRSDDPAPDGCNSGVDCSLREAVIDANATSGLDIINLGSDAYTLTITGPLENSAASGDLDLTDDVTITGTGTGGTEISASGLSADPDRVFHVRNGATVAINDLVVRDGEAPTAEAAGGGILQEDGSLSLTDALVTDNHNPSTGVTPNDADGGGIATINGSLALTGTTVSNNTTNDDGGGIVIASGTITLDDVMIGDNIATGPGSVGVPPDGSNGGGIVVSDGASGTFTDVTISGNQASDSDTTSGNGGFVVGGTITASDLVVDGNTAENDSGGGGTTDSGSLTVTNLTVSGNTATSGAAGGLAAQGVIDVTNGQASGNTAGTLGGGAVVGPTGNASFSNYTFDNNNSTSGGAGAAVLVGGQLAIAGSSVNNNIDSGGTGGGIFNQGTTTLTTTEVRTNTASGGGGGIMSSGTLDATTVDVVANDARPNFGGGIYSLGSTTLNQVAVVGNQADVAGGGIAVGGGSLAAQDLSVMSNLGSLNIGGGIVQFDAGLGPSTIDLERALIADHSTINAAAGVLLADGGTNAFANVTVSGNEVTDDVGAGAGVFVTDSGTTLDLDYSTIADNTSAGSGGLFVADGATVQPLASLISDNAGGDCGTSNGGAITSNDFNVAGDDTCGLGQPNDLNNAGPMLATTLGPLADNGGWNGVMLTHALLDGNPALDRATDPGSCPATDERGNSRPNGPACDSGAFEAAYTPPTPTDHNLTIDKTLVGEARSGGDARWNITIGNSGTDPAPGRLTFADTLPDAVRFVSVDAPEWDCSTEGRTLTCFYDGDLAPGVVTKLDIVATVVGPPGSSVANTASVSTFGSVDPTFATAPGTVAGPGESPGDPTPGEPGNEPTDAGLTDAVGPGGSLPFTGFDLTSIALGALVAVVVGTTLAWRPRRGASA